MRKIKFNEHNRSLSMDESEIKKEDRVDRGEEGVSKNFGGPAGPPTCPEPPVGQTPGLPAPTEEDEEL